MDFDRLLDDLKQDEGWEPSAYQDSLGYWTIGYGFLIDKAKGGEIPLEVAEFWLEYEAGEKWNAFVSRHPWVISQPEDVQRALANMSYQMGVGGVSKFENMIAALKAGDREKAALEAMNSTWADQTPNRALRVSSMLRGTV